MPDPLPLSCACGTLRGHVLDAAPATVNRVVCYCDDCQAYARWLGRDDIVDAQGGTDVVQVRPGRVRLTEGVDQLRLMRLSPKGLSRWYAGCCRTPVGNTLARRSPFVGMPRIVFEPALDARVGPALGGIQGRFARGGCPAGVAETVGAGVLAKSVLFVVKSVATGGWRGSPLFDADGNPVVEAEVLTKDARAALYS